MFLPYPTITDGHGPRGWRLGRVIQVRYSNVQQYESLIFGSRFIRDHFSHMFRVGSVSPTRIKRQTEEKWVNSMTLLENMKEEEKTPPKERPSTPSRLPVLLTPSSRSPPRGTTNTSPLTPLQYIRKMGVEPPPNPNPPPLRAPKLIASLKSPTTPAPRPKSKSPSPSPLNHFMSATPSRPPRWR